MEVLPENEKVIKLSDDDDGWVDTHHGVALEQMAEAVQDMKLDMKQQQQTTATTVSVLLRRV